MAPRMKGKQYYETTKEKPFSPFHVLMVGGSVGMVVSFFAILLLGNYMGLSLDTLIFSILIVGILGFALGTLLTWLFVRYFATIFQFTVIEMPGKKNDLPQTEGFSPSLIVEGEEVKGKSVDYVFPELSPDKQ